MNDRRGRKKALSFTSFNCERKFFILALKDSDAALVERLSKQFIMDQRKNEIYKEY